MSVIFCAALSLLVAVGLGAFGAHGLREMLETTGRVHVWETAVQYQAWHGLALLAIGVWRAAQIRAAQSRLLGAACVCWLAGVFLFSGSLFAICLGAPRWLGPVTPLGGVCLLSGWTLLAVEAWRIGSVRARHHDPA